ncbi:hypothetical protein KOEU_37090 [Komagataeibacter europaeus]|uniref:Uncharacterized protein n=1 Tax=Komagataeibacter europaeus TaxID=33995 RepID=A0A0M0ECV3_KOMEU|nr:hypothetical protein [Komagataeibacter europaeus]KON62791.1 hypothetical protein KOEU_37090 [Komagataeibacter europaeus]
MSFSLNEPMVIGGRHYVDNGVDFGPLYLHQLRGGFGPKPAVKRVQCATPSAGQRTKTRFEREMDRARQSVNTNRQRGVKS